MTENQTLKCITWFCAFFLASTVNTYSQWELRYPSQYDYSVSDFVFTTPHNGFYSTDNGLIQKTTDSGKSWQLATYIKADKFLSISFADSNYGAAYSPYSYLADTTYLLSTTDGGLSWTVSNASIGGSLVINSPQKAHLLNVNDSTVLATFEDGNILRSVDKLRSWQTVRQNRYYIPSDYGIPFGWISSFCKISDGVVLAVGADLNAYQYGAINDSVSYILKSTDNGKSWKTLWRGSKEPMRVSSFVDTVRGWMCSDSAIYKTMDGGVSWTLQKTIINSSYPLVYLTTVDSSTVYAVDLLGELYSSTSGGSDWKSNYSFPTSRNSKIQFLSKDIGYGGGSTGLYNTTDGGLTWTKLTGKYAGTIDKLQFTDDKTGYAIVNLTLNKTTDGGYSWNALPESQYTVYGLSALDSLDLWITTQDSVSHSIDGGISWTKVHFDSAYVHNVYFFDRDFGVLYDIWKQQNSYAADYVIVTTDGGSTWHRYQLPMLLYGIKKVCFINKNEGWLGSTHALYRTHDGGKTWEEILRGAYGNPWNRDAFSFDFVDANSGWFAYYDLIYNTTDGGTTWSQSNLPHSVEIKDMKFINKSIGFAVGEKGRIFSTTDAGIAWSTETNSNPYDLFSISIVKSANVARTRIGGDGFTILARDIITHAEKRNDRLPTDYFLSQNYPNPFNPSTTLRYGLPARSRVRLRIYNILGQVVADLVNTEQAAGWNEVFWNANVASGLYFYRLEAVSVNDPNKRFVDVKKMILLK